MSRVKKNFAANLAGSGWTALAGLICTPLYIKFLGMEAYGLIGFYFMMQGIIQILDVGLSPTMNREMARYSVLPEKAGEARDFVRTLETGYWAIGILIGLTLFFCAPLIATSWIKPGSLPRAEVIHAVRIMGALSALQWPLSFYHGGLLGLQRQVLLNGIAIAIATLASFGAVFILWRVSPTVTAFFTWQVAVGALNVALTTAALWHSLPESGRRPRFDPALIRNIWKFAAGMSGITLTSLILTQLDKVILSKLLDLKEFGYYMLATVVSGGISTVIITPMFNTVFPRFSALVASKDEKGLTEMYHGSTQVLAVLLLSVASVLAIFSRDIMFLWTQDGEIARNTAGIVSILVIGTALNGMMNIPHALQLAYGLTRLAFMATLVYILILGPAIVLLTLRFGAVGAASAWAVLNVIHVAVMVPLTHRRFLQGEGRRWLVNDFSLPLLGALAVSTAGGVFFPSSMTSLQSVGALTFMLPATFVGASLAAPLGRRHIKHLLSKYRAQ